MRYNTVLSGQTTSDDIPLTSLEESLLSLEKLDRASPELWPEQSKIVCVFSVFSVLRSFVVILL